MAMPESPLDHIDPQVLTAARDLSGPAKVNPPWLWFNVETVSFARWAKHPLQAPYIRADLAVLATTHQRTLEALREALEEAKEALEISDCPRPIHNPNEDMEAQVCVAAGECGCCYGTALAKVAAALARIKEPTDG